MLVFLVLSRAFYPFACGTSSPLKIQHEPISVCWDSKEFTERAKPCRSHSRLSFAFQLFSDATKLLQYVRVVDGLVPNLGQISCSMFRLANFEEPSWTLDTAKGQYSD